jgi:hypothetical protein
VHVIDINGDEIGISFAVSVSTLQKLSSAELLERAFPILCESCGRKSVAPLADGTVVEQHELRLALRCVFCGARRYALVAQTAFAVRRKADRRAAPRVQS